MFQQLQLHWLYACQEPWISCQLSGGIHFFLFFFSFVICDLFSPELGDKQKFTARRRKRSFFVLFFDGVGNKSCFLFVFFSDYLGTKRWIRNKSWSTFAVQCLDFSFYYDAVYVGREGFNPFLCSFQSTCSWNPAVYECAFSQIQIAW